MLSLGVATTQAFWKKAIADSATFRRRPRRSPNAGVDELKGEIDELRLHIAALYRILIGAGVLTVEQARELLAALDSEDGAADGMYSDRDLIDGSPLPESRSPFADLGGS